MTESELKFHLQQKYNHSIWKDILNSIFPKVEYLLHPVILAEKTDTAKFVRQIGNLPINGNNIGIFEVEVSSRKNIARNRVELRKIAASYIDQGIIHGAFVFYFASNQNDYRFTFIAKKSNLNEDGELVKYQTPPKRFTYVLGPNESCTTAAKRMLELQRNETITLDSIIQAFSIEKLTKEFFKQYKEHYLQFCNYLSNSPYRKSVFNILRFKDIKENSQAEKPIRDFIKLLLGRIVFLHFLQKKSWLGCPADTEEWTNGDSNFTQNLFLDCKDKKRFHSEYLTELFFNTLNNNKRKKNIFNITKTRVPYLNGGLFDNAHPEYNKIDFPEKLFEELFDFFTQYNFTIDEGSPDEHEVGIAPEMLGHIFENLLEDNKDKGAFYTPKEIVHFMCHESLIQYLKTNISSLREDDARHIESFIRSQELAPFIRDYAKEIDSLLDKVKICDPAIGSGAFPMGLLKEIYQAKILLYPYLKTNRRFDPAVIKRNIIQNSIYGVDIDSGAVDIARLRFWLSLIVDEEEPIPLPNLDYKIMQGDSLLESFEEIDLSMVSKPESFHIKVHNPQLRLDGSFEDGQTQIIFNDSEKENLSDLMKQYFTVSERKEKDILHKQIDKIVLDSIHRILDRHRIELESSLQAINEKIATLKKHAGKTKVEQIDAKLKKDYQSVAQLEKQIKEVDYKFDKLTELYSKAERPFFLWHLYYQGVFDKQSQELNGFDIVIGNPPYVQLQKESGKLAVVYENQGYQTFERTGDIYTLFYERGYQLLKQNGILCFITSNKWMRAGYGESLRKYFTEKSNPILLIDFAGQKIFEAATVDTNILLLRKDSYKMSTQACIVKNDYKNSLSTYIQKNSSSAKYSDGNSWTILSPIEQRIKEKVEQVGKPLKDWDINIYRGVLTGYNEAFIIDGKKKDELIAQDPKSAEIIRPILRGRDIKRYGYDFADLWLINTHNGIKEKGLVPININDYPAVKRHLDKFYPELEKRADKGDTPYNLRNCAYMEDFFRPKIIYPGIMRIAKTNKNNFPRFSLDTDENFFFGNDCYFIVGKYLDYLWLILNSDLLGYLFRYYIYSFDETGFKIFTDYFQNIPIPLPNERVLGKVEYFKNNINTNEINNWIYQIIGLTEVEIAEIENSIELIINENN
jgi:hypothetical protein